ncbi:MAG: polysaccharide biosynthesis C-terminal domain-containing protein [Lachnospiraceae bacterium]|nr:polysaccharide biosynthesis C-terminal domain-containing protein [Lachnospiraceae bacterium]
MMLCISNLCGVGGGSLISRLLGRGDRGEARKVSVFSLCLAALLSILFSLIIGVFMTGILGFLGAGENTLTYSRQYIFCVLVLGALPTVLSNVMSNLIRSIGMSREASFGIMMGGILNIILDPIFMFVILPQGNEVLGVGIATLLSNCTACSYFIIKLYRIRNDSPLTFDIREGLPKGRNIIKVFAVGFPAAIAVGLFDLDYMILDKLMAGYSDLALAAIGIVLKVERFPLNVGLGICQGMMPLVAYNYSSGNEKRMDGFARASLKLGLVIAAVSIVLYESFAPQIIRFFIAEVETAALGVPFIRARVLATPFMFISFFFVHTFQAYGKGRIALILGVMRWLVLNIPMLFIMNRLIGMYGLVWSQVTADIINVILSFVIYRRERRKMALSATQKGDA